jgi:hypothetical protein
MTARVNEHVTDAFTLVNKVSQAKDLQDLVRVQAEFVQKKISMVNDRVQQLNDMAAVAGNFVGAFAGLFQWRKDSEQMARNSPDYTATGREGPIRTWTSAPKAKTDNR